LFSIHPVSKNFVKIQNNGEWRDNGKRQAAIFRIFFLRRPGKDAAAMPVQADAPNKVKPFVGASA
jgi:hypothetical protein